VPECSIRTLEKLIISDYKSCDTMNDNSDLVDYIKEVRMILADSIDTLLNLEYETVYEKDEEIIPINNVVELVDMSYDVANSTKLKQAESEFMKRTQI
jgi:hypothetical protein